MSHFQVGLRSLRIMRRTGGIIGEGARCFVTTSQCRENREFRLEDFPVEEVQDQYGTRHSLRRANHKFETYYGVKQGICETPRETKLALDAMRTNLPAAFHLNPARPNVSRRLKRILRSGVLRTSPDSARVSPVDPEETVWRCDQDRHRIKLGSEIAEANRAFHEFLSAERFLGNLMRQELVSQVPVLMLDVKSTDRILDMCSAPGSKTGQLVQALHGAVGPGRIPSGAIVGNEYKPSRCSRLVSTIRPLGSPCVMLVNHDGKVMPEIYETHQDGVKRPVRYDKIVCDEPCSGDGTLRKNPTVWQSWTPGVGNTLHRDQYAIAKRGLELLKVGGEFAYSTCSMNPIENEAVVARLVSESGENLEVVDCSDRMARLGFKYLPGFTKWKVVDNKMNEYESYDQVPARYRSNIVPGLFHPNPSDDKLCAELHKSMRFLPHLNDDGGFYVAILRKTGPMPWEEEENGDQDKTTKRRNTAILNSRIRFIGDGDDGDNNEDGLQRRIESELKFLGVRADVENLYTLTKSWDNIRLTNATVKNFIKSTSIRNSDDKCDDDDLHLYYAGTDLLSTESLNIASQSYKINSRSHYGARAFALPQMSRRIVLEKSDFLTVLASTVNIVWNEDGEINVEDNKTESVLSADGVRKLHEIGIGSVKLACRLERVLSKETNTNNSVQTIDEEEVEEFVECLAFVGGMKLMLRALPEEKYHCRLLLEN